MIRDVDTNYLRPGSLPFNEVTYQAISWVEIILKSIHISI